jgi:predicted nucleic acid binding AN1-type Zn finger protein
VSFSIFFTHDFFAITATKTKYATMSMELENIGKHCDFPTCGQKDFLPFKCEYCRKTYCGDHRSTDGHQCKAFKQKDRIAPTCPICGTVVALLPGENPDLAISNHIDRGCRSSSASSSSSSSSMFRQKCSVSGCRPGPNDPIVTCKSCGHVVCFRHRNEVDHDCSERLRQGSSYQASPAVAAAQARRAEKEKEKEKDKEKKDPVGLLEGYNLTVPKVPPTAIYAPVQTPAELQSFPLIIVFPRSSGVAPKRLSFNPKFVVGKVLDMIATEGKVANRNNVAGIADDEKLAIYRLSTIGGKKNPACCPPAVPSIENYGRLLPNMMPLVDLYASGALTPGDLVLLEKKGVVKADSADPELLSPAFCRAANKYVNDHSKCSIQ